MPEPVAVGVDFALILALVAGVTNVIPYFGPFLGAIPAVLTALQAPALALKTALVYTIIQQAESHFIALRCWARAQVPPWWSFWPCWLGASSWACRA